MTSSTTAYDADGLPDPTATNNTLNAQQQFMIQTYLNGGGSFFMASMGILSQLGDVPFRRNVLQVAGFMQNPDPPAAEPEWRRGFWRAGDSRRAGVRRQRHECDAGLQQLSVV